VKYFSTEEMGRVFVVRLDPGDYLLESIMDMVQKENVKDAVVVSAIGTLDQYRVHMVMTTGYPPENRFEHWNDKPLELASIGGVIANGQPHLHVVVSDSEKAYSGHLEKGCRVLYLAEIVIIELKSMNLTRISDDKHILRLTSSS
jgi:predicted DNA-binding protein with PD1-like motif